MKLSRRDCLWLALGGSGSVVFEAAAAEAPAAIPPHLALARTLVEKVRPEHNVYRLGAQRISVPGPGSAAPYAATTDCSGLLLALFASTGGPTARQLGILSTDPGRKRPRAEDFVYSIEREIGFRRLLRVTDLRPGDVLAHAMLRPEDKARAGTTGHVMLVDSEALLIDAKVPRVRGTRQLQVSIIDSNAEWLGSDDTRLADPAKPLQGLGRGTIRLYADEQGALVGWARNFSRAHRFFSYDPRFPSDTVLRKAAMGRLRDV